MSSFRRIASVVLPLLLLASVDASAAGRTMADVLAASQPSDWRPLDPQSTLYMDLPMGRVVIELAPGFAPKHVANLRTLARGKYFDGLAIMRSQDNYVEIGRAHV